MFFHVLKVCLSNTTSRQFFKPLIFCLGCVFQICLTDFLGVIVFLFFVFLSNRHQIISTNSEKKYINVFKIIYGFLTFFQPFHLISRL